MNGLIENVVDSVREPNWSERLINQQPINLNSKWVNGFLNTLNNQTTLKVLKLRWKSTRSMTEEEVEQLCQGIMNNPMLKVLNFQECKIRDPEALKLMEGLKDHKKLTSLNFLGNQIGKDGVNTLKNWVKNSPSITSMKFSDPRNDEQMSEDDKKETTNFIKEIENVLEKNQDYARLVKQINDFLKSTKQSIAGYEQLCEEIVDFAGDAEIENLIDQCGDLVVDLLVNWNGYLGKNLDIKLEEYERLWSKFVYFCESNPTKLSIDNCKKLTQDLISKKYDYILNHAQGCLDNYQHLCHEIFDLSERYSIIISQEKCIEIRDKILNKRQTLLFQRLNLNDFKQFFEGLQNFSKEHSDTLPSYDCAEKLFKFLKRHYENLHDKKRKRNNHDELTFNQIFEATHLLFTECFEIHSYCEDFIFSLLVEKTKRFLNQQNKTSEQFNSLYTDILYFSGFYFDSKLGYQKLIDTLIEMLPSVNNPMETIPMKQLQERITELEKINLQYQDQNKHLIDLLGNAQKHASNEKSNEIEILQQEYNKSINEQIDKINRLEITHVEEKNIIEEFLSLEEITPKVLDRLVAQGKILSLKRCFAKPEALDIKYLSLIHLSHDFENLGELKKCGAIVTWEQLREAPYNVSTDHKAFPRLYIRRLQAGFRHLKTAWLNGNLDMETQLQLDNEVINLIRDDFSSIAAIKETEEKPSYLDEKLSYLRALETKQWFKHKSELKPDRLEYCNKFIFDCMLQGWFKNGEYYELHSSLDRNYKFLLLERFKSKQLPEPFNDGLNENILNAHIYERFVSKNPEYKACPALQQLIISEGKAIKKEGQNFSNMNKVELDKMAISRICQRWFNGELTDRMSIEFIDKISQELLNQVPMDGYGTIKTDLKKEAVSLLFQQLENKTLEAGDKRDVKEKIEEILKSDAPTEEQKEIAIQNLLEDLKAGRLGEKLSSKCLSFIETPLDNLERQWNESHDNTYRFRDIQKNQNTTDTDKETDKVTSQTIGMSNSQQ